MVERATLPGVAGAGRTLASGVQGGLRDLAELAFGSLTRIDGSGQGEHLALLHAESLELDLSDPSQREFGDYELLERLGEGGMGVVYKARHVPLDRIVAVKLLAAGPWASREFIERFAREAQHAARMQHPHIVTVFEVGEREGLHFFSMQWVEGRSLSAVLKQGGKFGPLAAAGLMHTVAEAVAYAHSLGVLHLDLKPGNVLIDPAGAPHVADFGLARRLDVSAAVPDGDVSGTPSYMAPEQTQPGGAGVTVATDVWGLGAILYELLTGAPPFRAGSARATLHLVQAGQVRAPRRFAPGVPLDLQAITLRCLAREPAQRYPSARALADDLARFTEGRPVLARPLNVPQRVARWVRREPRLAATALLAFGLLIGGLLATTQQWYRADRNADTARANAASARARLWGSRNAAAQAAMESGDGWNAAPLLLANLSEMEAQGDVEGAAGMRRRLGILENANPRLIDAWRVQNRPTGIAFSPDGRTLAVSGEETGVRLFDVATGAARPTIDSRGPAAYKPGVLDLLQFAPDGRTLIGSAGTMSDSKIRPTAQTMLRIEVERNAWLHPPAGFANFVDASYGPDGRAAVLTDLYGRSQFWATSPWRPLSPLRPLPAPPGLAAKLIAPNGKFIAMEAGEHAVALVDARTLGLRARIGLGAFGTIAVWVISPDARWLALGDHDGRVVVVDCTTHAVRSLQPQGFHGAKWIAFSDDGGWLAVAAGAGGAYLWSWPEGRLLAPPFSSAGSVDSMPLAQYVQLDRAHNRVLTSDETDSTALWQVAPPAQGADRRDAVQVAARINARRTWRTQVVAWNVPAGLLASVAKDRVRLERLPPLPLKAGRGAPLRPGTLRFDGRRRVIVDGDRVHIVGAHTERPLAGPFGFGRPPTFAELTADGAALVVVVGRTLHVVDVATGRPRFTAVELEGTPAHADISPDGTRIVVAWSASMAGSERNTSEAAELRDLATGKRLAGPVELPGAAADVTFSPDGTRLLAWNQRDLMVRSGLDLAPIEGPLKNFRPRGTDPNAHAGYIHDAVFDAANGVQMIMGRADGNAWHYQLSRYGAAGDLRTRQLPDTFPNALLPLSDGRTAVFSGYDATYLIDPQGAVTNMPVDIDDAHRYAGAISPDGRWLARVRRDGVTLLDLHDHTRVTALRVALPRPDQIWQLTFSPDGTALLARTLHNRQIVWNLEPDPRPVAAIARELALRDRALIAGIDGDAGRDPDAAERAALRARDPGAPHEPLAAAAVPAVRALPGGAIPPRDPATPPALLDLTRFYTYGIADEFLAPGHPIGDFSWLPPGVQRLRGIDYDLRGGVRLARGASMRVGMEAQGDANAFAAIDALVVLEGAAPDRRIARVRFDYLDGTHAELPLDVGAALGGYWRTPGAEASALVAIVGVDSRWYWTSWNRAAAFAVRSVNPYPARRVRAVTLSNAAGAAAEPIVLALTLAPAGAAGPE